MRFFGLLWRHWLVLLLSLIVSAAVATPFALRSRPTYTSTAELFQPAADPVAKIVSDTSALSLQLQSYAGRQLGADVRVAAGADRGKIVSVVAELSKNETDLYQLTALAETPSLALKAVQLGAAEMKEEANRLLVEQFADFSESTTEDILVIFREKRRLTGVEVDQQATVDGIVSELEALDEGSPEATALEERLEEERGLLNTYEQQILILEHQLKSLRKLPGTVGEQVSVAQGVARVVSGPSKPEADTQIRVIQLVGGAVIAGLLAAVLLTLWLERHELRRDSGQGSPPPRLAEVIRGDPGPDSSPGLSRTMDRER